MTVVLPAATRRQPCETTQPNEPVQATAPTPGEYSLGSLQRRIGEPIAG